MNVNETGLILLVEDNPDDVELTLRAFAQEGIANPVKVAVDGRIALDWLLPPDGPGLAPSLILLDLKLPRVDGLEVLRAIRNDARTALLPVVILTTSTEERDVVESYRLGTNSFVRKPVGFEDFTGAVRQLGLYWLVVNHAPPIVSA